MSERWTDARPWLHEKLLVAGIEPLRGPYLSPPRLFFRTRDAAMCAALNRVGLHLTIEGRAAYWREMREGQGYDDAVGFWLRCWAAAFDLPCPSAWSTAQAGEAHDGR